MTLEPIGPFSTTWGEPQCKAQCSGGPRGRGQFAAISSTTGGTANKSSLGILVRLISVYSTRSQVGPKRRERSSVAAEIVDALCVGSPSRAAPGARKVTSPVQNKNSMPPGNWARAALSALLALATALLVLTPESPLYIEALPVMSPPAAPVNTALSESANPHRSSITVNADTHYRLEVASRPWLFHVDVDGVKQPWYSVARSRADVLRGCLATWFDNNASSFSTSTCSSFSSTTTTCHAVPLPQAFALGWSGYPDIADAWHQREATGHRTTRRHARGVGAATVDAAREVTASWDGFDDRDGTNARRRVDPWWLSSLAGAGLLMSVIVAVQIGLLVAWMRRSSSSADASLLARRYLLLLAVGHFMVWMQLRSTMFPPPDGSPPSLRRVCVLASVAIQLTWLFIYFYPAPPAAVDASSYPCQRSSFTAATVNAVLVSVCTVTSFVAIVELRCVYTVDIASGILAASAPFFLYHWNVRSEASLRRRPLWLRWFEGVTHQDERSRDPRLLRAAERTETQQRQQATSSPFSHHLPSSEDDDDSDDEKEMVEAHRVGPTAGHVPSSYPLPSLYRDPCVRVTVAWSVLLLTILWVAFAASLNVAATRITNVRRPMAVRVCGGSSRTLRGRAEELSISESIGDARNNDPNSTMNCGIVDGSGTNEPMATAVAVVSPSLWWPQPLGGDHRSGADVDPRDEGADVLRVKVCDSSRGPLDSTRAPVDVAEHVASRRLTRLLQEIPSSTPTERNKQPILDDSDAGAVSRKPPLSPRPTPIPIIVSPPNATTSAMDVRITTHVTRTAVPTIVTGASQATTEASVPAATEGFVGILLFRPRTRVAAMPVDALQPTDMQFQAFVDVHWLLGLLFAAHTADVMLYPLVVVTLVLLVVRPMFLRSAHPRQSFGTNGEEFNTEEDHPESTGGLKSRFITSYVQASQTLHASGRTTRLRRLLFEYGLVMCLRVLTLLATYTPDPSPLCRHSAHPSFGSTCGDLIFSGHSVLFSLCGVFLHEQFHHHRHEDDKFSVVKTCRLDARRLALWCYVAVGLLVIILSRLHYTRDVLVAVLVVASVHHMLRVAVWRRQRRSPHHNDDRHGKEGGRGIDVVDDDRRHLSGVVEGAKRAWGSLAVAVFETDVLF